MPWKNRAEVEASKDVRYFVGVDLGQTQDYTAISMIKQQAAYVQELHKVLNTYRTVYLHRFELQTEYPVIVKHIKTMFVNAELMKYGTLILDQTGVGRAVADMMRAEDLFPIGVTITGGYEVVVTREGEYHIPKRDMISALSVLLQSGRLKISKKLPHAELLQREMENFRVKTTLRGHEQFEAWREGEHDDLVMSLALCAWYAYTQDPYYKSVNEMANEKTEEYDPLRY